MPNRSSYLSSINVIGIGGNNQRHIVFKPPEGESKMVFLSEGYKDTGKLCQEKILVLLEDAEIVAIYVVDPRDKGMVIEQLAFGQERLPKRKDDGFLEHWILIRQWNLQPATNIRGVG